MKPYPNIIILILLVAKFAAAQNPVNPIPVIFEQINTFSSARSFAFGQIGSVSGNYYASAGIHNNPALIANRNYNRGFVISGPLLLDEFKLVDLGYQYSSHPKNYFAIYAGFWQVNYALDKQIGSVLLKTDEIRRLTIESFRFGRIINDNLSYGIAAKFARPVVYTGVMNKDPVLNEENSFLMFDAGLNYRKPFIIAAKSFQYESGLYISNIGRRVDSAIHVDYPKAYLPITLHFGNLLKFRTQVIEKSNLDILFAYEASKLMVPSPPQMMYNENGQRILQKGRDPDVNILRGMVQSFYDAPDGFSEEMKEIIHKTALELAFTYDHILQVSLRMGIVYEHPAKGNESYYTTGIRFGLYGFYFDFAQIPGYSKEYYRFNIGYVIQFPDGRYRFPV